MYPHPGLPNLTPWNHTVTSGQTPTYNCIAWSIGYDDINLWPDEDNSWPIDFPRVESLETFTTFYRSLGYEIIDNGDPEPGFGKIAIYIDGNGVPTHVARQKDDRWTSKINIFFDIEHGLPALEGGTYGRVAHYMRRRLTGHRPELPPLHPPPPLIIRP